MQCESSAEEVSFEWSHSGILSRGSKVRTTLLQDFIVQYGGERFKKTPLSKPTKSLSFL